MVDVREPACRGTDQGPIYHHNGRGGNRDSKDFRLCLGDEIPELKRCLFDRKYDVLVVAYEKLFCPFGDRPIEVFAEQMQCPVILIGSKGRDDYYLNSPATMWTPELGLSSKEWKSIRDVTPWMNKLI